MQFVYAVIGFVAWTVVVIAATLWWAKRQPKKAAAIGTLVDVIEKNV